VCVCVYIYICIYIYIYIYCAWVQRKGFQFHVLYFSFCSNLSYWKQFDSLILWWNHAVFVCEVFSVSLVWRVNGRDAFALLASQKKLTVLGTQYVEIINAASRRRRTRLPSQNYISSCYEIVARQWFLRHRRGKTLSTWIYVRSKPTPLFLSLLLSVIQFWYDNYMYIFCIWICCH
jgi:hypothetical protein